MMSFSKEANSLYRISAHLSNATVGPRHSRAGIWSASIRARMTMFFHAKPAGERPGPR